MRLATALWLLPVIADSHWQIQQRREKAKTEWNESSSRSLTDRSLSLESRSHQKVESGNSTDNSTAPTSPLSGTWLCSPKGPASWLLMQATRLGILERNDNRAGPADPCFGGFTKFFWATLLAVITLLGICLLVPVMLEITRRRPPGVPLVLFGITFDCEPKPPPEAYEAYDYYRLKQYEMPVDTDSMSPLTREK
mgnify:FL=1